MTGIFGLGAQGTGGPNLGAQSTGGWFSPGGLLVDWAPVCVFLSLYILLVSCSLPICRPLEMSAIQSFVFTSVSTDIFRFLFLGVFKLTCFPTSCCSLLNERKSRYKLKSMSRGGEAQTLLVL